MRNKSKDKRIQKSPARINKTPQPPVVIKIERPNPNPKIIIVPNENTENKSNTNLKPNNEKELRAQLDNTIKFNMDKDVNLKETEIKIKKSIEKQEELKKKIDSLNERIKKQNQLILLYKNRELLCIGKIKDYEEKIKNLNSQIEKLNEGREKINKNIEKGKKEFDLVSGSLYKLGEIYWEAKEENYIKKAENSLLIKQKILQYNGDF